MGHTKEAGGTALDQFIQQKLKLKSLKCHFFQTDNNFLSHKVSAGEWSWEPMESRSSSKWPL